jgi:hypothetical protein
MDVLEADKAVWLSHGTVAHKECGANTDADVAARHAMAQRIVAIFPPSRQLVAYSDVSRLTDTPGEIAVHRLMALNRELDIDWFLVLGEDGSHERVSRILRNVATGARRHHLSENTRHTLSLVLNARGPQVPLDEDAVCARLSAAGVRSPLLRLRPMYPAFNRISSTRFRATRRPHLVPLPVLEYLSERRWAEGVA